MKYFWMVWIVAGPILALTVGHHILGFVIESWVVFGGLVLLLQAMWWATVKPPSYAYGSPSHSGVKVPPVDGPMATASVAQQMLDRKRNAVTEEEDEDPYFRPPWY